MDKYVVSCSPFVRGSNDINKMFMLTSLALLTLAVFGFAFFGIQAFIVVFVSIGICFLSEALYNLLINHKFCIKDMSCLVTGLVLGLSMPVNMPVYIVVISAFVADFIVKLVFGGLGKNKFNPAVVGRLFAGFFASGITTGLYNLVRNGELYVSFTEGGTNSILNLVEGKAVGGIGTTCIILILVGYVFLVYLSVIDWKIPLISVVSYMVVAYYLAGMESALLNLCSGSFLFASVFMITDPNTSPNSNLGKILYSILFGGLAALVWNLGGLGEDTIFAIVLFVDILVPFMDKYLVIRHKPLGGYRYAHKN